MERIRITLTFDVDRELAPGCFYDPEDFVRLTTGDIEQRYASYNPELISSEVAVVEDDDASFLRLIKIASNERIQ